MSFFATGNADPQGVMFICLPRLHNTALSSKRCLLPPAGRPVAALDALLRRLTSCCPRPVLPLHARLSHNDSRTYLRLASTWPNPDGHAHRGASACPCPQDCFVVAMFQDAMPHPCCAILAVLARLTSTPAVRGAEASGGRMHAHTASVEPPVRDALQLNTKKPLAVQGRPGDAGTIDHLYLQTDFAHTRCP